jgi:hypothetical protein
MRCAARDGQKIGHLLLVVSQGKRFEKRDIAFVPRSFLEAEQNLAEGIRIVLKELEQAGQRLCLFSFV